MHICFSKVSKNYYPPLYVLFTKTFNENFQGGIIFGAPWQTPLLNALRSSETWRGWGEFMWTKLILKTEDV